MDVELVDIGAIPEPPTGRALAKPRRRSEPLDRLGLLSQEAAREASKRDLLNAYDQAYEAAARLAARVAILEDANRSLGEELEEMSVRARTYARLVEALQDRLLDPVRDRIVRTTRPED